VVEHRYPIGNTHDDTHLVLDEKDGDTALFAEALDQGRKPRRLLRVHPRRRLVEQKELRLGG
jgi:hypothetical protein